MTTNTGATRREGMKELHARYGVKPYRVAVKFACGHRGTLGTGDKKLCFECCCAGRKKL